MLNPFEQLYVYYILYDNSIIEMNKKYQNELSLNNFNKRIIDSQEIDHEHNSHEINNYLQQSIKD